MELAVRVREVAVRAGDEAVVRYVKFPYYPVMSNQNPYAPDQYYQPPPVQRNYSLHDEFDPFATRYENQPYKDPRIHEYRPLPIYDDSFMVIMYPKFNLTLWLVLG